MIITRTMLILSILEQEACAAPVFNQMTTEYNDDEYKPFACPMKNRGSCYANVSWSGRSDICRSVDLNLRINETLQHYKSCIIYIFTPCQTK